MSDKIASNILNFLIKTQDFDQTTHASLLIEDIA